MLWTSNYDAWRLFGPYRLLAVITTLQLFLLGWMPVGDFSYYSNGQNSWLQLYLQCKRASRLFHPHSNFVICVVKRCAYVVCVIVPLMSATLLVYSTVPLTDLDNVSSHMDMRQLIRLLGSFFIAYSPCPVPKAFTSAECLQCALIRLIVVPLYASWGLCSLSVYSFD